MALHDDSRPLVNTDDTSLTGMVVWSVAAGVAALAFGIVCLRSGTKVAISKVSSC
jgi:uncharacterized membrane protein HdeD (DUF308 family)